MKKETVTIERYYLDDDYILEVEEKNENGLIWYGWLTKKGYVEKDFMYGWPADQTQADEPHIFTKDEAVELFLLNIDDYIEIFKEEYETE